MWLAIAVGAAAAGGVAIGGRRRREGWPDAVLAALLPPCAVIALALAAEQIATAPANGWNDIRLAPSAAMRLGYDLYALPGDGPMLGHIYGPVSPLVYMPAALIPTPPAAIRAGVGLTLFLCLIPAVSLVRSVSAASRTLKTAGVLLFALVCFQSDVLSHAAFWIHADTPAVAFMALACVPLVTVGRRQRVGWQTVSALTAVLAVGSKQLALPVVFALAAYMWLADGWRSALRYLCLVGMWGLVACAAMLATFDVPAMLYQAIVVPSEHPWRFGDGPRVFVQTLRDLVPRVLPFAALVGGWGAWRIWRTRDMSVGRWVDANPWVAPLIVAVFCLPTAILGRMKIGGSLPTLMFAIYPLALAALLALLQSADSAVRIGRLEGRKIAAAVVLASLLAVAVPALWRLQAIEAGLADFGRDADQEAFSFVRAHPGEVYLPLHPLVSLLAEGRVYHVLLPTISQQYVEYAARELHGGRESLGGSESRGGGADAGVIVPYLPPKLRYVMFPVQPGTTVPQLVRPDALLQLPRYVPGFTTTVAVAPGWMALVAAAR